MSGHEAMLRRLWTMYVEIARPQAAPVHVQRAVDSIMRDPKGQYAKEIKRTAERTISEAWVSMESPKVARIQGQHDLCACGHVWNDHAKPETLMGPMPCRECDCPNIHTEAATA